MNKPIITTLLWSLFLTYSCQNSSSTDTDSATDNTANTVIKDEPLCTIPKIVDADLKQSMRATAKKELPIGLKDAFFYNYPLDDIIFFNPEDIKPNTPSYYFNKLDNEILNKGDYKLKETDCYYAVLKNTGSKQLHSSQDFSLITINKSGEGIDTLLLFKDELIDHYTLNRYYYIDTGGIIHLKDFVFFHRSESYNYLGHLVYKIRDDGKIIRYIDRPDGQVELVDSIGLQTTSSGIFRYEKGTIKNHIKIGQWEEFSTPTKNASLNKGVALQYGAGYNPENQNIVLYGIGSYKLGVKDGTWNYYEIILDNSDPVGSSYKMTTKRDNKIILTEQYDNGKLIEQTILKKP